MHVRSGIPNEWFEKRLKDISIIDRESLRESTPNDYKFSYISLSDVDKGTISLILSDYIFSDAPSRARRIVQCNDVLMSTVRPNLQAFFRINENVKDTIASTGFAVITPKIKSDSEYIYQYIYSHEVSRQIYALVVGSNYPAINSADVKNLKILFPGDPLERQKIAQILSTWDKAIENLEALIAAKQKRKKALMQQLLTGKQRFTEHVTSLEVKKTKYGSLPAEWKYLHISDAAKQVSIKNNRTLDLPVLSCTKHNGLVDSLAYFGKRIYSEDTSTYKIVPKNSFAYATNHIEEGSIGYQSLYNEALISPMYTVFQTKNNINDEFLYRLLKTELYRHIFEANTSASVDRRGSLRWNEFSQLKIPVPSLPEQQKIAGIFSSADKEITIHQNQLTALKLQKKGLMQQLLTGKRRVQLEKDVEIVSI